MKEMFKKNKMLFVVGFVTLIVIILVFYFIFKNKVEYKDVIEYESFDKNSSEKYNKYKKKVKEDHFDLKEDNKEIVVNYNKIDGYDQVNVVVSYEDREIINFESFNPVTNVIKYKELFLVFVKENANSNRESLIVLNKLGDKVNELIASEERDIIELEDDMVIFKKYTTLQEYPEADEETGKECGKKEIYRLNDFDMFLENYEYMYCMIPE